MNTFFKSDLYEILCKLYSHERVKEITETLKDLESPRQYTAFQNSTAWCEEQLKKAGLSDVRRIAHKADGKTVSFDFIMPQAWDLLGRSTLKIVAPVEMTIADTDVSTIHVSEYSAPTPAGGVTAELVDFADLDPENPDCKGKFVFHRGYLPAQHPRYHNIAKAGCAGIVFSAFETITYEPDVPSWTNGHGHIGWYHLKEDPVVPVFNVTPKVGIELAKLLSKGKVTLHGEMNTKIYDGEIYTVTATIPGESEDEFAILGHLYEPFFSDDAQGFAVGLEMGIMLKKLIDDGVLPKPQKTLRLIFSMERYGYAAFFAQHDKRILAAMSIDTVTCEAGEALNNGFIISHSPLSGPFFGDMLFDKAMRAFCSDLKWKFIPGNLSDDCWMAEPTMDMPTNWPRTSSNDGRNDYHHADAPIFDAVEYEKLKRLVPMLTAYTAVLICGDRAHFAAMAEDLERTAALWLEREKNFAAGRAVMGQMPKQEALWYNKAQELLYLGRMASFDRFHAGVAEVKLPAHWADTYYDTLPDRPLTATEEKAAKVRYRITSTAIPFSQARVPAEERVSWHDIPELVWAMLSPERSVLDAVRLHDAVLSCRTCDESIEYYMDYFRFLEKYGYLEEVK